MHRIGCIISIELKKGISFSRYTLFFSLKERVFATFCVKRYHKLRIISLNVIDMFVQSYGKVNRYLQ